MANRAAPVIIHVTKEYHVTQARQAAVILAREIGFSPTRVSCVATAVSELAGNLFLHASRGGAITLAAIEREGEIGIEAIAQDQGPGIPDVNRAMEDGFSTSGGLGEGLPGAERLMDEFEITSTVGVGTRIVARKWQPCR